MTNQRAARLALSAGAQVVLASRLDDVRWLTGFSGSTGWAVFDKARSRGLVMVDGRYAERAADEIAGTGAPFEVVVARTPDDHDSALDDLLASRSLGVDPTTVTAARMATLRARCEVTEEATPFDELRRTKDASEIAAMERAAAIADVALQSVVSDGLLGRKPHRVVGEGGVALAVDDGGRHRPAVRVHQRLQRSRGGEAGVAQLLEG